MIKVCIVYSIRVHNVHDPERARNAMGIGKSSSVCPYPDGGDIEKRNVPHLYLPGGGAGGEFLGVIRYACCGRGGAAHIVIVTGYPGFCVCPKGYGGCCGTVPCPVWAARAFLLFRMRLATHQKPTASKANRTMMLK